MNHEYSVNIVWSKEDGAYIAVVPELPGCLADGATQEEALAAAHQIAKEWIEVARLEGRQVPPPMSLEDCERANVEFAMKLQSQVQAMVSDAVRTVLAKLNEQTDDPPWLQGSLVRRTSLVVPPVHQVGR